MELYIDRGKDYRDWNMLAFNKLFASKKAIEQKFGGPIEWQSLEGKQACRIKYTIDVGGYLDESKWPEIQEAMIDAMIRFEKAISPYIAKLKS